MKKGKKFWVTGDTGHVSDRIQWYKELPLEIKEKISDGFLDEGHVQAIFSIILTSETLLSWLTTPQAQIEFVESAKREGLTHVYAEIREGLTFEDEFQIGFQSNEASETAVPMTFVDYTKWIWNHTYDKETNPEGYKQEKLSKILSWSQARISQYTNLKKVGKAAWEIITTFIQNGYENKNKGVNQNITTVIFTEKLLRGPFLEIKAPRQYELVSRLADSQDNLNKKQFKGLAQAYKYRETMFWHCRQHLGKTKFKWRRRYHQAIFTTCLENCDNIITSCIQVLVVGLSGSQRYE